MRGVKGDRRVKYTKMVLKESFVELLEQKDISQITIKEICEKADINRATFYSHYNDQYDLLRKIQEELYQNIESNLTAYTPKDLTTDMVAMVERILEYLKENKRLCKLMLGERGDLTLQKSILSLIYERNVYDMTKEANFTKEEVEYIYSYSLFGSVGVIQKWLNDDLNTSTKMLAEIIVHLNIGLYNHLEESRKVKSKKK